MNKEHLLSSQDSQQWRAGGYEHWNMRIKVWCATNEQTEVQFGGNRALGQEGRDCFLENRVCAELRKKQRWKVEGRVCAEKQGFS